jgi:hypothetical protein
MLRDGVCVCDDYKRCGEKITPTDAHSLLQFVCPLYLLYISMCVCMYMPLDLHMNDELGPTTLPISTSLRITYTHVHARTHTKYVTCSSKHPPVVVEAHPVLPFHYNNTVSIFKYV